MSAAGNDLEAQPIFELLREQDPLLERTLGVLTKLDKPNEAYKEQMCETLMNERFKLGYGWVGLSHLHQSCACFHSNRAVTLAPPRC